MLGVTLAAYANTFGHGFIFDDRPAIVDNPTIRDLRAFGTVLSPPADGSSVTGRPLVNLSFALNYALSGPAPWNYHATNLAIHALAALALFGVVRRTAVATNRRMRPISDATLIAFAIASWWAVHPLQTESVTFVVQRTESLVGLFYLLTLYCFVRSLESDCGPQWSVFTVAACLAGMATKEVMVTAPLVLLLYDRVFVAGTFAGAWRARRRNYLGLAATWLLLVLLVARDAGKRGTTEGGPMLTTVWHYLLTQCEALTHYLRLTFWPHPLVLDYGTRLIVDVAEVWWRGLLVLIALAASALGVGRGKILGFCGACFFLILAPSSSFVPLLPQPIAEHRMYLPAAFVIGAVVLAGYRLAGRAIFLATVAAAAAATVGTLARNRDYSSEATIWRDTIAKCPGNHRAYYNLGCALEAAGNLPQAQAQYETALKIVPDYADAHNNLGRILSESGRVPEAIAHLKIAAARKPGSPEIQGNLGIALLRAGQSDEAIACLQRVVAARPDDFQAFGWLGNALLQKGRIADAMTSYAASLRIRPDRAETHANLGAAYLLAGDVANGITHLQRALELDRNQVDAHRNLAIALTHSGRAAEALPHWREVVRLRPDDSAARAQLELATKSGSAP